MSAPDDSGGDKTAEEVLAALLTEREQLMVLQYSREKSLESDDAVYFLVALLKIFAHVHDQMLTVVAAGEHGRSHIETATNAAIRRIDSVMQERAAAFDAAIGEAVSRLGVHTGEIHAAMGVMRAVREEMEKTTNEAKGVYRAYKRLADDGSGSTLSQLFQKAAIGALDKRVPFFDDTIRTLILDTIARAARRAMIIFGVQFVLLAILMFIWR